MRNTAKSVTQLGKMPLFAHSGMRFEYEDELEAQI